MLRTLRTLLLALALLMAGGCAPAAEVHDLAEKATAAPRPPAAIRLRATKREPAKPEPFSIIWMTDTQNMTKDNSAPIHRMAEWIDANWEKLGARYAVLTGDLVGNGLKDSYWERIAPAMAKMPEELPFMTIAGNHDVGSKRKYANYLRWRFDTKLPQSQLFEDGRGSYAEIESDFGDFLLVGMGITISEAGYDWLNEVFAQYPDHIGVLALHDYLNGDGSLSDEGSRVFKRVVKENPNLRFILCGHDRGVTLDVDKHDDDGDGKPDRTTYGMMYNYQSDANKTGYFRILTFHPDGSLDVTTYSPYMQDYNYYENREDEETFTIKNAF